MRDAGSSCIESRERQLDRNKRCGQRKTHEAHQGDKIGHSGVSRDKERRLSRHDVEDRLGYRKRRESENVGGLSHLKARKTSERDLALAPEVGGATPYPRAPNTMPGPPRDHQKESCDGDQPEDGHEANQPVGPCREGEVLQIRTLGKQLCAHERAPRVPIEGVLYVEIDASPILYVSDDDLVWAGA